jgi:hypothetical protein
VQFIETSYASMRSAIYRLRRSDRRLEFRLFPMVHVGSPEYYADVAARLEDCDLVLLEGVTGWRTVFLTSWYRVVEHTRKLGLVTQQRALNRRALSAKVVNADVSGEAFAAGWRRISLRERALLYLLVPLVGAYLYLFGTRSLLANQVQIDDLPSRDEVLRGDAFAGFDKLVVDDRDTHLLRVIEDVYEEIDAADRCVAIVYGARHMRAVTMLLMGKLGYRVANAEWITVFEL